MASCSSGPNNVTEVRETLFKIQKNLECPICLELLSDPYTTQCSHPFCRTCIIKVISASKQAKCPLCKETITKRSLNENRRLGEIVEAVKELEQAFIKDTGIQKTPPPVLSHTHEASGTPGIIIHSLTHPTPIKPGPSKQKPVTDETPKDTSHHAVKTNASETSPATDDRPAISYGVTADGTSEEGQGTSRGAPMIRRKRKVRFKQSKGSKKPRKTRMREASPDSQHTRQLLDALENEALREISGNETTTSSDCVSEDTHNKNVGELRNGSERSCDSHVICVQDKESMVHLANKHTYQDSDQHTATVDVTSSTNMSCKQFQTAQQVDSIETNVCVVAETPFHGTITVETPCTAVVKETPFVRLSEQEEANQNTGILRETPLIDVGSTEESEECGTALNTLVSEVDTDMIADVNLSTNHGVLDQDIAFDTDNHTQGHPPSLGCDLAPNTVPHISNLPPDVSNLCQDTSLPDEAVVLAMETQLLSPPPESLDPIIITRTQPSIVEDSQPDTVPHNTEKCSAPGQTTNHPSQINHVNTSSSIYFSQSHYNTSVDSSTSNTAAEHSSDVKSNACTCSCTVQSSLPKTPASLLMGDVVAMMTTPDEKQYDSPVIPLQNMLDPSSRSQSSINSRKGSVQTIHKTQFVVPASQTTPLVNHKTSALPQLNRCYPLSTADQSIQLPSLNCGKPSPLNNGTSEPFNNDTSSNTSTIVIDTSTHLSNRIELVVNTNIPTNNTAIQSIQSSPVNSDSSSNSNVPINTPTSSSDHSASSSLCAYTLPHKTATNNICNTPANPLSPEMSTQDLEALRQQMIEKEQEVLELEAMLFQGKAEYKQQPGVLHIHTANKFETQTASSKARKTSKNCHLVDETSSMKTANHSPQINESALINSSYQPLQLGENVLLANNLPVDSPRVICETQFTGQTPHSESQHSTKDIDSSLSSTTEKKSARDNSNQTTKDYSTDVYVSSQSKKREQSPNPSIVKEIGPLAKCTKIENTNTEQAENNPQLKRMVELNSDDLETYSLPSPNEILPDDHPFMSVHTVVQPVVGDTLLQTVESTLAQSHKVDLPEKMKPPFHAVNELKCPLKSSSKNKTTTTFNIQIESDTSPKITLNSKTSDNGTVTIAQTTAIIHTKDQGKAQSKHPQITTKLNATIPMNGPDLSSKHHSVATRLEPLANRSTIPEPSAQLRVVQTPAHSRGFHSPGGETRHTLSLVGSGLSKSQLRQAQQFAHRHSGRIASVFNCHTTHVVVSTDPNDLCPRTIKYLQGVLARIWVLRFQWVENSLREDRLLPEESYEVRGDNTLLDSSLCVPARARLSRAQREPELFSSCRFYLHCDLNGLSKDQLSQLLCLGGGEVVERVTCDSVMVCDCVRHVELSYVCLVVTSSCVLDCISSYKKLFNSIQQ